MITDVYFCIDVTILIGELLSRLSCWLWFDNIYSLVSLNTHFVKLLDSWNIFVSSQDLNISTSNPRGSSCNCLKTGDNSLVNCNAGGGNRQKPSLRNDPIKWISIALLLVDWFSRTQFIISKEKSQKLHIGLQSIIASSKVTVNNSKVDPHVVLSSNLTRKFFPTWSGDASCSDYTQVLLTDSETHMPLTCRQVTNTIKQNIPYKAFTMHQHLECSLKYYAITSVGCQPKASKTCPLIQ